MTTGMIRESAKIYQFPKRNIRDPRLGAGLPKVVIMESGGSWYHEDAIREDDDTRKQ
ncbi:hypothetical protein M2360_005325 [Rhizobium sp. SG_E_25_P2]|jgi:Protein of unknown function (DUF2735)|uniref:DUF2735 domain-containing protein n=1 Tax=Rhizobium sp. SG_E_25_P2 TaxID=2879942 RepID=UPI00247457CB|nr:DUF2735 domain-containing protein [Rhizobium sp. SG_E_25_P2]MDH6269893.1 hypothetical protein [Rhizobium sp. SG_E_25_P2]